MASITRVVNAASSGSSSSAPTRTIIAFQIAQPRPRPRRLVSRQLLPEHALALSGQERPCDCRIARRIADPGRTGVDDGAQPAGGVKEQVAWLGIAVEPHRRTVPPGRQRRLPDLGGQVSIDLTVQRGERRPCLGVVVGRRSAAEEVVRPWQRAAGRVHLVQGGEKAGEVGGEPGHVRHRRGRRCPACELGSRTDMRSPRRNVALSQPSTSTGRTGSSAHCGNWVATSRETSSGVMSAFCTSTHYWARSRLAQENQLRRDAGLSGN